MAVTIPGPFSEVSAGFTKENMASRGWTFLSKSEMTIEAMPAVLVHFEQPLGTNVFRKWSLIFGTDDKTVLVTAVYPKSMESELSNRLKSVVLATQIDSTPAPAPGSDLPFDLTGSAKMKITPGINKTIMYTLDGRIPVKSPKDPFSIVAPSLSGQLVLDQKEFATRRIQQTAHTKNLVVKSTEAITIDGLDGYETLAEAEDEKSGTPLVVYQVILFKDGYIALQGLVGAELSDEFVPEFKAMARSLKQKRP